jgi:radical SAM family RiPP maturation amino acid epimerase
MIEHATVDPNSCTPGLRTCHAKRFLERWIADPQFRQELAVDPQQAASARGLAVDPDEIRILWDDEYKQRLYPEDLAPEERARLALAEPPAARDFINLVRENNESRDRMRAESDPSDPRFRAWRRRQIKRSQTEFRVAYDHNTPHVLAAIELNKGCSVGCWFCGVSAPRLDSQFLHTPENSRLFKEVLAVLGTVMGPTAGGHSFLYWATDPFDNPDYEKFCIAFHEVFGHFPVLTTSQPLKNVERTRQVLALSRAMNATRLRFSILSIGLLNRMHAEFTAEELADVDLIPLNQGSLLQKSSTGRARERYLRQAAKGGPGPEAYRDQTISCVSGFLLNMIERSVKLISPCSSSDRWPLGYYLFAEATFRDAADLADTIETMIQRHMPLCPPATRPVRFRDDLQYERLADSFRVFTPHGSLTFGDNPFFPILGDLVAQGRFTPSEIGEHFQQSFGIEPTFPSSWLNRLFEQGVLSEEPEPERVDS